MKTNLLLLITLFLSFSVFSQTANSVASGSWFMPTTWDCGCIPTSGYNVTIGHTVTLASNWLQSGGTITVNAGGTLMQDATNRTFAINGGTLVNHGTFTFSKMAVLTGPLTNSGTFNANDSLFINVEVTNTGTINSANYLNGDVLINSGNVNAGNLLNDGNISNSGSIIATNFYNNNTFSNTNSVNFINSTNNGYLINDLILGVSQNFTNSGILQNNSYGFITIDMDCTNGDSLDHDAHWYNNGSTLILHDFSNIDTLDGTNPGSFCVAQNSSNFGIVQGTFDFCDQLSTGFGFNTGTIAPTVTFCNIWCFGNVSEKELSEIYFFPNPIKDYLTIQFKNMNSEKSLQIVNSSGQIVFEQNYCGTDELIISRNNLPSGLYLLKISDGKSFVSKKLIFE